MDSVLVRPLIVDVPVYDADQAEAIGRRIDAVADLWLRRQVGFATIGVATYLDIMCSQDPEHDYYARVDAQNALLREHFGDVLDDVAAALSQHLDAPTRFEPAVALPGFHVFEYEGITITDNPSQHFDLQHRALRWPFAISDEHLISFTLTIRLPALGGGLQYWDVTEADFHRLQRLGRTVSMEQLGKTKPARVHRYEPGKMAVQMAPLMHRIAPIDARWPDDQRITLQGHGVKDGETWVLYW